MKNHPSRRQFLKKSGVILAVSGFAALGKSATNEEGNKDEEISPPEDLMREHGVLKRILLIYGEAIRRIDGKEDLPPEPLQTPPKSSAISSKIITRSSRRIFFFRASRRRKS